MIGRLRGEVIERDSSSATVDVMGVGYVVSVTPHCNCLLGAKVDLFIHTHVREDALVLFGFADQTEREVFDLLITVPSVGPTKALNILATPYPELITLVRNREVVRLSKLPGIGKKTAERIVLDLRDKLESVRSAELGGPSSPAEGAQDGRTRDDLVSALINLGFKPQKADDAAKRSLATLGAGAELEVLLKEALTQIGARA